VNFNKPRFVIEHPPVNETTGYKNLKHIQALGLS